MKVERMLTKWEKESNSVIINFNKWMRNQIHFKDMKTHLFNAINQFWDIPDL